MSDKNANQSEMLLILANAVKARVKELYWEDVNKKSKFASDKQEAKNKKSLDKVSKKYYDAMLKLRDFLSGKNQSSNKSLQVGTFFSWIMDSEAEFKAIVQMIAYKVMETRKALGNPISKSIVGSGAYAYHAFAQSFSSNHKVSIPDIEYVADINDKGEIELALKKKCFEDILTKNDITPNDDIFKDTEKIYKDYYFEWLESLDGLGPQGTGYFFAETGKPPVLKIYQKSNGVFDKATQTWTPIDSNLHLKESDYNFLKSGLGYPEKSFQVFLKNKCCGLNIEPDNDPKQTISPSM